MKEGIAELLERVSKIKSRKEQVAILRKDHSIALEVVIDCCFNPSIKFLLPDGEPPYKALDKAMDAQAFLVSNIRRIGIFHSKGNYPDLNQLKRESQFVSFIEGCDPDDAKLLISVKDKKMPYKGITKKLFEEAWPALASTWKAYEKPTPPKDEGHVYQQTPREQDV